MEAKDIHKAPAKDHGQGPVRLFPKKPSCAACVAVGRGSIKEELERKPLIELSVNTTQKARDSKEWVRRRRPPRTRFGCTLCNIPLCKEGPCWQEHLNLI